MMKEVRSVVNHKGTGLTKNEIIEATESLGTETEHQKQISNVFVIDTNYRKPCISKYKKCLVCRGQHRRRKCFYRK